MTEYTIRKVNPVSDAQSIAGIYNHYILETTISFETTALTTKQMAERIESISRDFPYFVAEMNGRIVGYAYAHPWKERKAYSKTLETTVYIENGQQSQGIGKMLMSALIKACREHGFHALIACITAENAPSIHFHKKIGFKPVSHFLQVGYKFNRYLDVIDLELLLN